MSELLSNSLGISVQCSLVGVVVDTDRVFVYLFGYGDVGCSLLNGHKKFL